MRTEREKPVDPAEAPDGMRETANRLLRTQGRAQLATLLARDDQADGRSSGRAAWPFVSLVTVATRFDGRAISPLLLISDLAEHTRNLRATPRLSLLFEDPDMAEDPLASARLTLVGMAEPSRYPEDRDFFVERHPSAALYADFGDFNIWAVRWERAHLVAGFGRIRWMTQEEISAR